MNKDLKDKAEAISSDLGFSSLQETIRVLLTKFSKREFSLKVEEVPHLSKAAEKRFRKAVEDITEGRDIYKPKDKKEFFELLRS